MLGSYAEGYRMYGGPEVFYHQVVEVRFYDLAAPLPLTDGPAENRFIRGMTPQERRVDR